MEKKSITEELPLFSSVLSFFFSPVPIIPEFLYFIRHRHDNVSTGVVTELEPFATFTTSTIASTTVGLLDDGAYEMPGTNISNLCFSGSTKRKRMLNPSGATENR